VLNVARIGKFSSDRTVQEYARDIWHIGLHEKSWRPAKGGVTKAPSASPVKANGEAAPVAEVEVTPHSATNSPIAESS
jgi:starch phosphorylase